MRQEVPKIRSSFGVDTELGQEFSSNMMYYYLPLLASSLFLTWPSSSGISPVTATAKATYRRTSPQSAQGNKPTLSSSSSSSSSSSNNNTILFGKELTTGPSSGRKLQEEEVPNSTNHQRIVIISTSVGTAAILILGILTTFLIRFYMRRKIRQVQHKFVAHKTTLLSPALPPNTGARCFKYEDIKQATDSFSDGNIVGVGGFATVYRGRMPDGAKVAVKKIKNCTPEGDTEFRNEVEAINSVRHKHLVVLRGCCVASNCTDGHQRLLVYDYMPNGTLEDHLFNTNTKHFSPLSWSQRRKIAIGTAKGIAYLHEGIDPSIIHRDIKTSNILLDAELNAKVADFGLARITEEGKTHITTRVAGTHGYLAPEYALYGQLTEKSDVYSFGVLLLVLMSGRRALDLSVSHCLISDWAWGLVKEGRTNKIIDARIQAEEGKSAKAMERFILVGILCAHLLVAFRPTMSQALKMLEGDLDIPCIPDRPHPLNAPALYCMDKDYSSSSSPSVIPDMYGTQDMLR